MDYFTALIKSKNLIIQLIDKSLHPLQTNKIAAKIWSILERKFQHISPMSVTCLLVDA